MGEINNENKKHPLAIGMRTVKTALTVFLCLVVYSLAERAGIASQFDAFLACTAAIICIQDSMEKSVSFGLHRIYGTGVGALLGVIFLYVDMFFQNRYLILIMCAVGIIVLITVCNALNISDSIVIGCVVFLVIVLEQTLDSPLVSSIHRLLDTVIGIAIAILINHFIHNPDARGKEVPEEEE
ncbi:MAG: aromatic acid exporter family protein [Clostridiales Family XIII bacterium]|nr:aromatic acid exporter family protein [Clostridiales Family XIII bacterium]